MYLVKPFLQPDPSACSGKLHRHFTNTNYEKKAVHRSIFILSSNLPIIYMHLICIIIKVCFFFQDYFVNVKLVSFEMLKSRWNQTWVMGVTCGDLHVLVQNVTYQHQRSSEVNL